MSESGGSGRASTRLRGAPNRDQYDKVKTKYKVFDKRAETEYARVEALHATKPFTATGNPYEYAVLYHLSQLKGEDRRRIKCIYSLHFFAFRRTGALISRSLSCVMFFPAAQDQPSPKGSPKPGKHGKGIYTISYMHFSNLLRLLLFLEMCVCIRRLTFSHFLCVAGGKNDRDKNAQSALDAPRSADKTAADADNEHNADREEEEDAAVHAVQDKPPALGSRSPTPPQRTGRQASKATADGSLADHLASLVAEGEQVPGIQSEDELLTGETSTDNVVAAHVGSKRARQKAVEQDATESDETVVEKTAHRAGKDSRKAGKDSRKSGTVKGKGRVEAGPVSKRPRNTITVEDSDEERDRKSRHKSVEGSKIYKDWDGPLLAEVRRRFTTLIAARDGHPLRFGATYREMNYRLALQAAKDVMPKPQYSAFRTQMEAAFKDGSKE
jgi:hypothetical protein